MKYLFFLAFITLSYFTNAQGKVCFINNNAIYGVLPDTKLMQKELTLLQNSLATEYQGLEQKLNDNYTKFVTDSATLTPEVKKYKRTELQKEIESLSAKKSEFENRIQQKNSELNEAVSNKVNAAIKKVAIANGYNHILSTEAAILYSKKDEITDRVKVELGIK